MSRRESGSGLNVSAPMVIGAGAALCTSGLFLALGDTKIAAGVAGTWALILLLVSPRAGIILALAVQTLDVAFNPSDESGFAWLSAGRILIVLCAMSYLGRFVVGRTGALRVRPTIIALSAFAFWAAASVVWAEDRPRAAIEAAKLAANVIVVIAAADTLGHRRALSQAVFIIASGLVLGGLTATVTGVVSETVPDSRLRLEGGGATINSFAITLGVGAIICVALLALRPTRFGVLAALGFGTAASLLILQTGTRSVIIGVPLACIFGILVTYWRKLHKVFTYGALALGLCVGVPYWAIRSGYVSGGLSERIAGAVSTEFYETDPRWGLWADALLIYAQSPIGTGIGGEGDAFFRHRGVVGEAHNAFLSVLVQLNVVGLLVFVLFWVLLSAAALRVGDPGLRVLATTLLFYMFFQSLKGTAISARLYWQPIALVMAAIEADLRDRRRASAAGHGRHKWG